MAASNIDGLRQMDRELFKACSKGDLNLLRRLLLTDPNILLSATPQSNNCLHIAVMLGHDAIAMEIWSRVPFLLFGTNVNGETPLILALMAANNSLATAMITAACQNGQHDVTEMLLKVDRNGDNALHHALRNDLLDLALQLLKREPRLSEQVNRTPESPMFMATRKGYNEVVREILQFPNSSPWGPKGCTAFYAAVREHNTDLVKLFLERRPELAYIKSDGYTVLAAAVAYADFDIVKLLLEHDHNLAYITSSEVDGDTPFNLAAFNGFVQIAKEIFSFCPDSVHIPNQRGQTALHLAVLGEHPDFVEYVLETPELHCLMNQADINAELPLHYAARRCNPEVVRLLLSNKRHDYTAFNKDYCNAIAVANSRTDLLKTVKWIETYTLLISALPAGWTLERCLIYAKQQIKKQAIQEVKSLTQRYTTNTSLVAALLATITFAAAFTLPGGYSSDPSDTGLPIFARKAAFQLFLISDTIAMCCSIAVAFLCVLATWEDLDYLLHYRKTTRTLMWCAYGATSVAFCMGLFTVIAPKVLWLAILIMILCIILPVFSKIIGDWPLLIAHYRLGRSFRKDLVPNI